MAIVPTASGHVLIADPNPSTRRALAAALQRHGLIVELSEVGGLAGRLAASTPDVAVVALPDVGGLELVDAVRRVSTVPLIVLLGPGLTVDAVETLDHGADDCVQRLVPVRELAAKVRAVLRRASGRGAPLRSGALLLDAVARRVEIDGRTVDMPPRELELLAFLMAHPGVAFSRRELLEQVWHASESWLGVATVTEHVRRLRLRLEPDPSRPRHLVTVRGVGYRFDGGDPPANEPSFPRAPFRASLP